MRIGTSASCSGGGVAIIDQHISQLDQELATPLSRNQDAVELLAEVPGLGMDLAQQIAFADLGRTLFKLGRRGGGKVGRRLVLSKRRSFHGY